jgi:hypothetical protein
MDSQAFSSELFNTGLPPRQRDLSPLPFRADGRAEADKSHRPYSLPWGRGPLFLFLPQRASSGREARGYRTIVKAQRAISQRNIETFSPHQAQTLHRWHCQTISARRSRRPNEIDG